MCKNYYNREARRKSLAAIGRALGMQGEDANMSFDRFFKIQFFLKINLMFEAPPPPKKKFIAELYNWIEQSQ